MISTADCYTPRHLNKICDQAADALVDYCLLENPKTECNFKVFYDRIINCVSLAGDFNGVTISKEALALNFKKIWEALRSKENQLVCSAFLTDEMKKQHTSAIGYACAHNSAKIPNNLFWARDLCQSLYKNYPVSGEVQVSTINDMIVAIVVNFPGIPEEEIRKNIDEWLDTEKSDLLMPENKADDIKIFQTSELMALSGQTGAAIVSDNYGQQIPVSGARYSGKDFSRLDRAAAYIARKIAVTLIDKLGLIECEVHLNYVDGEEQPIFAHYMGAGTDVGYCAGNISDHLNLDLSHENIIEILNADRPKFREVAEWGSFGLNFPWDQPFLTDTYVTKKASNESSEAELEIREQNSPPEVKKEARKSKKK